MTLRFLRAGHSLRWALLGLAVGCSSSGGETTPDGGSPTSDAGACVAGGSGTLTVNVTGLPAGVAAKITVTGAAGSQELTASGSLTLPGGTYSVAGATVTTPDPIVRSVHATTTTNGLCVESGKTATAEVVYALVPTSNKLWATNANGDAELLGFAASTLAATGTPAATVTGRIEIPAGVAFDKEGGLWALIGAAGAKQLAHYRATDLAASGPKTADITITGDALNGGVPGADGIAIDKAGTLWVSNIVGDKILGYSAASVIASGSPAPSWTISNIDGPSSLAFDRDGNLWVASANRVVEYVASRLAASTGDPPDIVLQAQTPSPVVVNHQAPQGLAFSPSDDLWVNFNGGTFVRFTSAERAASATVTPAVQLRLAVDALAGSVAFDESGGLWFAYAQGKLARLAPGQLTASADVTPETILTSPSVAFGSAVAFYPSAANLPLFASLTQP